MKLTYLPFPHTDSVFAVIGEEFGLLGVLSSGLIVTGIDQQFYIGVVGAVLLVAAYINIRLSGREKGG